MRDIEQKIREVIGTIAIEGMPLTEEDKDNLRAVLRGDVSYQEMKRRILAKYTKIKKTAHE